MTTRIRATFIIDDSAEATEVFETSLDPAILAGIAPGDRYFVLCDAVGDILADRGRQVVVTDAEQVELASA